MPTRERVRMCFEDIWMTPEHTSLPSGIKMDQGTNAICGLSGLSNLINMLVYEVTCVWHVSHNI